MTLRLSAKVRDYILQVMAGQLQVIEVYAGVQPPTPETPVDPGAALATFYVGQRMSAPDDGVMTLSGSISAVASGSGTAGWARWTYPQVPLNSIDGAVGLDGAQDVQFFLSTLTFVAGNPVQLTSLTITFPM